MESAVSLLCAGEGISLYIFGIYGPASIHIKEMLAESALSAGLADCLVCMEAS